MLSVCSYALVALSQDVILEPVNSLQLEVCVILIQGAEINPKYYIPLMQAIQTRSSQMMKVWVGIPQFPNDLAFAIDLGVVRIINKLRATGMKTDKIIMAGHSLGGAVVQTWTARSSLKTVGQILMGAFLTRSWKDGHSFSYDVPTLTIGAELDGLTRVTRIIEAFYTQILDSASAAHRLNFPVTIIGGITHMQFASGPPTDRVVDRDLLPERSYAEAHSFIAEDFVAFMYTVVFSNDSATFREGMRIVQRRIAETKTFAVPFVKALQLEGYPNFRPPCRGGAIREFNSECIIGCPFSQQFSQSIMAKGSGALSTIDSFKVRNHDSFRNVSDTSPPILLPQIFNQCQETMNCTLDTSTVTQGIPCGSGRYPTSQ